MKNISDVVSLITQIKAELREMESDVYRIAERHEQADAAQHEADMNGHYPVVIGNSTFMVSAVNLQGMMLDCIAEDDVQYYKYLDQLTAAYEALTNDPS